MNGNEQMQDILNEIKSDINSSASEIKRFMESSVFADFKKELETRISYIKGLLEDDELEYSGRAYDVFRGGLRTHREMLDIFEDLYVAKQSTEEVSADIKQKYEKEGNDNE